MASRKILLHVGPHKTGTSAVQLSLYQQKEQLLQFGWQYETLPEIVGEVHQFADWLSVHKYSKIDPAIKKINDSEKNVLLSSENFSRADQEGIVWLRDALTNFDVHVVYFLRSPIERLYSQWKESVKHGYEYAFSDFMVARLLRPIQDVQINDYNKIKPWAETFGLEKVRLIVYEAGVNVVEQFWCEILGLQYSGNAEHIDYNKSFDEVRTEVLRALLGRQIFLNRSSQGSILFADLEQSIREKIMADDFLRYSVSLNHIAFSAMERQIMAAFGSQIAGMTSSDKIFAKREFTWQVVNPNFWLKNINLLLDLERLKAVLDQEFGYAQVDARLKLV